MKIKAAAMTTNLLKRSMNESRRKSNIQKQTDYKNDQ
jgi:hypothetical protein